MQTTNKIWTLCGALLACATAYAEAPVAANSQYFTGWQMAKFVTRVTTPTAGVPIVSVRPTPYLLTGSRPGIVTS